MSTLITKTSSAVAVPDALTTVIDWTYIADAASFTVVVANAGGGSGDALDDVQIDESPDGGVTASLDQHADTPAVPIAAGAASQASFTTTARWLRVRAICDTDEDTTATAILLAETVTPGLCTLAELKDHLGLAVSDASHDLTLAAIAAALSPVFDRYLGRIILLTADDATDYYTGGGPNLWLRRYPVVSITSVIDDPLYAFEAADALTANTDYRLVNGGVNGVLRSLTGHWLDAPDAIAVTYRGGYCSAGSTPGEGETPLPGDIRLAAVLQAAFLFKRRDDIGLQSVSFEGGAIQKFAPLELLAAVRQLLEPYKRHTY